MSVLEHAVSCTEGSLVLEAHVCRASIKLFIILSCKEYMAGGPTADSVLEDKSKSSLVLVSPWPLMSKATTRYLHHYNASAMHNVIDTARLSKSSACISGMPDIGHGNLAVVHQAA